MIPPKQRGDAEATIVNALAGIGEELEGFKSAAKS